jgi:hypothetical protein
MRGDRAHASRTLVKFDDFRVVRRLEKSWNGLRPRFTIVGRLRHAARANELGRTECNRDTCRSRPLDPFVNGNQGREVSATP